MRWGDAGCSLRSRDVISNARTRRSLERGQIDSRLLGADRAWQRAGARLAVVILARNRWAQPKRIEQTYREAGTLLGRRPIACRMELNHEHDRNRTDW